MKASVILRPEVVVTTEVPEPTVEENDIMVKVIGASICNATDYHIYEGTFKGYHDFYPQILGHEVFGEVVELGSKVNGIEIGERLVFYTMHGAFCEFTKVDADLPWARVSPKINDEAASLIEMGFGAHIQSIYPSRMEDGENVLVIGQGPMGLITTQCIKAMADVTVAVMDLEEFRLEKAIEVGADFAYNNSRMSNEEIAKIITDDIGEIDLVHVCTAEDLSRNQDLFEFAISILKPFGRLTGLNVEMKGLNHYAEIHPLFIKNIELARSLDLETYSESPGWGEGQQRALQMVADWVAEGKVDLETLITHSVDLDGVEEGLFLCKKSPDKTIKVVVDVLG